jgi:peptidoglycan/xylan/chitin deacetylase (PgdA/CDA1 family)
MTIGSHGLAHRDWRTLTDDELDAEVVTARELLEGGLGHAVRHVACPFGAYDRRVLGRLRRAGYERVFTSDGGRLLRDRWLTPRTTVHAGDDVDWLRAAMERPSVAASAAGAARRLAKRMR